MFRRLVLACLTIFLETLWTTHCVLFVWIRPYLRAIWRLIRLSFRLNLAIVRREADLITVTFEGRWQWCCQTSPRRWCCWGFCQCQAFPHSSPPMSLSKERYKLLKLWELRSVIWCLVIWEHSKCNCSVGYGNSRVDWVHYSWSSGHNKWSDLVGDSRAYQRCVSSIDYDSSWGSLLLWR